MRLLLTTPLRELARGRVTGPVHREPRRVPAVAALPAALADVVADVAKRTHLWPGEKREIMRELSAHFADGLESGRGIEQLIADFGDPAQAAKLLRRAAKRNRPWLWRAMRMTLRALLAITIAIVVLYLLATLRFFLGRPTITTDYRVQLNAVASALPDEHKAWPLYRQALLAMPKDEPEATTDHRYSRQPLPGEHGWDTIEAYLRQAEPALKLARRASSKRGMGLIVGYPWGPEEFELWPGSVMDPIDADFQSAESSGLYSVLLPHLSSLRRMARTLGWDVQRAAAAGDAQVAMADLFALMAMSRHVRETPTFISELVGLAILSVATTRLDAVLDERPDLFSDQQLIELAHMLGSFDDQSLRVALKGERLFFDDVMQRLYTDDGSGDGRMTPRGLRWLAEAGGLDSQGAQVPERFLDVGGPALGAYILGRRDIQNQYERLMGMMEQEAQTPLWQRDVSPVDQQLGEWLASPLQRLRHLPLCVLLPAISKASINAEMSRMRRDASLSAIALELHHRRTGRWPNSLTDLVPQYLPSVPLDRFDGQAMRLTMIDGRPAIYSVGTDREDDGGTLPPLGGTSRQWYAQEWIPRNELTRRMSAKEVLPNGKYGTAIDGDWILWPPLPEPPLRIDDPASAP